MNKNKQFKAFLESMKKHNPTLIEAIQTGYATCFENMFGGDDGDDMTTSAYNQDEDEIDDTEEDVGIGEGPSEEDIIITSGGHLGGLYIVTCDGKTIFQGAEAEDMEAAIKDYMEREQFWPSIWEVSDHGNVSPYTLS